MTAATGGAPGLGAIRFRDALAAEFTKLRTLPQAWLALCAATAANTALGVLAATDVARVAGPDGTIPVARLGTVMAAPVYAFIAIAVYAAGSEYQGGQLRASLAAVPGRNRLFAAKALAAAVASLIAAVPAIMPGQFARYAWTAAATPGHAAPGHAAAARVPDLIALLAAYLLLSVLGFGLAAIARSVAVPLALLPAAAFLAGPALRGALPRVAATLPHEAALGLLGTPADSAALGRAGGLFVLTAWAALSACCAWLSFTRRDG